MNKNVLSVNHTFSAAYPDGFHEMTPVELKKFFRSDANRCGIYDKDRYVIISVYWVKPVLLGFMTTTRSVLRGAEMVLENRLQQYCMRERLSRDVMGYPATGIRFTYTVINTNITQHSDLYVVKLGKVYYAVQIIGRAENFAEDQQLMEELIGSMTVLS